MDDFDDFVRPPGQPARANAPARDPFADFDESHDSFAAPRGAPSHVLVDADDPDLMGDDFDNFGSAPSRKQAYPPASSRYDADPFATSTASFDQNDTTMGLDAPRPGFGQHMHASMESGLPLAGAAQTPAGYEHGGYQSEGPFADAYAAGHSFKSIEADDEISPGDDPSYLPYSSSSSRAAAGRGMDGGAPPLAHRRRRTYLGHKSPTAARRHHGRREAEHAPAQGRRRHRLPTQAPAGEARRRPHRPPQRPARQRQERLPR
ncbi:hypothetical protein L1887_47039 [Cichorium endivia]|nr:hypothetical protein L1887_47039 [Cichorium endivia]